jgi:hypothetical protein
MFEMPNPNGSPTVVELLGNRQNIVLAWEIWNTFPAVIERLQVKFWRTLERLIREKVREVSGWQLLSLPKKDADLLQQYFKLLMRPRGTDDSRLNCQFAIEQQKQTKPSLVYALYFGIRWSEEISKPAKSPEYEALSINLKKDDFSKDSWWIGYKYFDFKVGDNPEILEQLVSGDSVEEEVASEFASFVRHYANGAERLNRVLGS